MIDSKCESSSRKIKQARCGVGGRGSVNLLILNIGDKFEWLV